MKCQGYSYEKSTDTFTGVVFTERQNETKRSAVVNFIGKVAADILSCEKHLISGLLLRVSFLRKPPEFCLIYDDESKDYRTELPQANLYARKKTVSGKIYSAIESTLKKTPVIYTYTDVLPKIFLVSTGSKSWNHGDFFNRDPIRHFAWAMATNRAFLGSKAFNPKFNLENNTLYRIGYHIAGTPLQTDNDKKR